MMCLVTSGLLQAIPFLMVIVEEFYSYDLFSFNVISSRVKQRATISSISGEVRALVVM